MGRHTGTVKWFNDEKGWGFVRVADGSEAFVHYKNIVGTGHLGLMADETVEFDLTDGPKGRIAMNVSRRPDAPPVVRPKKKTRATPIGASAPILPRANERMTVWRRSRVAAPSALRPVRDSG